ncbi:hypothetical protein NP233_g7095 [Leucocoprinus birnbaumii]|uniref:Uncharacterized protein n=1 Tax=Leucocoprinus birnbaumii TaxID=56174 RepID=A0AAD5VPV0_9AGAR|nr:hypothetical protein NP233_g7095 [Leucocoprinus birnbaumii]
MAFKRPPLKIEQVLPSLPYSATFFLFDMLALPSSSVNQPHYNPQLLATYHQGLRLWGSPGAEATLSVVRNWLPCYNLTQYNLPLPLDRSLHRAAAEALLTIFATLPLAALMSALPMEVDAWPLSATNSLTDQQNQDDTGSSDGYSKDNSLLGAEGSEDEDVKSEAETEGPVTSAAVTVHQHITNTPLLDFLPPSSFYNFVVATTSYVADYSPTKDKTVLLVWCLNNLTETLCVWVASDDDWENPDDVLALARQVFDLIHVAWMVPGLMNSPVNSLGLPFCKGVGLSFHRFTDCQSAEALVTTHGTADTSGDVNMDTGSSPGPDTASVSGETTPKLTQSPVLPLVQSTVQPPARPPRSPRCLPPPPKQLSYAAAAKSALSLVKLTKTMPDLEPERIVAMHRAAEPSPDGHRKAKSTTSGPCHRKILVPLKDHIPSTTSFPLLIMEINWALAKQSLHVATDDNLVIITASIHKILDVPCFIGTGSTQVAITPTVIRDAMVKSPMASSFDLTSTPHVMRASPTSDTLIVWVNLHDSQSGANVKALVGNVSVAGAGVTPPTPAGSLHQGVPSAPAPIALRIIAITGVLQEKS